MSATTLITIIGNPPTMYLQPGQPATTPSHLMLCSAIPAIKEAVARASQVSDISDGDMEKLTRNVIVAIPAMASPMVDLVVRIEGIRVASSRNTLDVKRQIARILWNYNKFQGEKIWNRIVLVADGQQTVFDEQPPPE
ncbi:MAG: hypothetical protein WCG99_03350 [Candidatus Berkelbacteria bacterium]